MIRENGRPANLNGRSDKEIRTYDFLDSLGISYQRVDHPPVMTMEECDAIDAVLEAPPCKNLLLCNKQKTDFYLMLMPAQKSFKASELSKQILSPRLSFASGEFMEELLDLAPGSLTIMGLLNDKEHRVKVLIDQEILAHEYLGCHPCVNTATIRFTTKDLTEKILPAMDHKAIFIH